MRWYRVKGKLKHIENGRYPQIQPMTVKQLLGRREEHSEMLKQKIGRFLLSVVLVGTAVSSTAADWNIGHLFNPD